ncbi:MAG: SDR family oxidoreductase [Gammaproteobacteria bacterium]|nr:SDR family oxidoreductase [Gammaproteobacteria bacterium]
MLRLGITGGLGFLGWHIRVHVYANRSIEAIPAGRELLSNPEALAIFIRDKEAIVHLAGMNRGDDFDVENTNVALTQALIDACEREQHRPHILFANSTHSDRDTAYGRSKRHSAELLSAWAFRTGARFTNLVIPGVFGEGGRPFYNSVVSTFCYQLANGEPARILDDREIELMHAQDLAAEILACIRDGRTGNIVLKGQTLTIGSLLERLVGMAGEYRQDLLPSFNIPFNLALFNTYRSYLFPRYYPVSLERREDARGALFEAVRTVHGGQCFFSTTKPGITRGNHYHAAKIERFLVAQGDALIRIRRLFSREIVDFHVTGDTPVYVDMPTFHTHNITNVGSNELLTLFWAHEIFDPNRPDTYPETV